MIRQKGGGDIVDNLVKSFVDETPNHVAALREAADKGDAGAFKGTAHALRGIGLSVGASRMASICAELERLSRLDDPTKVSSLLSRLEEEFSRARTLLDAELARKI